jgi:intracellular sulfur oxidation DsrE/DsrF family protein
MENTLHRPSLTDRLNDPQTAEVLHRLLDHAQSFDQVLTAAGETLTESDVLEIADKIKMVHEDSEKGAQVTETSDDAHVAKLIKAHAKVVSGFVERGFAEAMKNHAVAGDEAFKPRQAAAPVIADHGSVVRLADAAQQPRSESKLLVDLTHGSDPKQLNAGLEKVAKYVSTYAGAGAEPADAQVADVFHGDASLAVLNPDAYSAAFKTTGNPNLELLRQLHEAGVELYVCGQSLISKGSQPEDVAVFVITAVSAITSVVNLQADGYAYLPLGN